MYRAKDSILGREVAVKILTAEGARDADTKARFLQEARMAGNITHDNIIRIHDYGEQGGRPYIVMEFLTGEDLAKAIKNGHTGDLASRLRIAVQIARALGHVHQQGIIHRDIKPENIHIDTTGRVRLMDFGIAKAKDMNLTRTGFAVGTPYYMAPEQVLGKPVTGQADVYAFALVMYELLTGSKGVAGDSVERLFFLIISEPLDLEPMRRAQVPEPLVQFVARCAAKKAEERPNGFPEVVETLEGFLRSLAMGGPLTGPVAGLSEGKPMTSPVTGPVTGPAAVPAGKSRVGLWVAVGGLVLALVAGGVWMLTPRVEKTGEVAGPKATPSPPVSTPAPRVLEASVDDPAGDLVLVAEGEYLAGADRKRVSLPAFYIDKTEVTNAVYARFAAETSRPLPEGFSAGKAELPVVNVTLEDARAFCRWAGKRLPNAAEWEKSARGSGGFNYPWGDEPAAVRANVANHPTLKGRGLVAGTRLPEGASPYGALHMTGNAWELVDEPVTPSIRAIESFKGLKPAATGAEPWTMMKGASFRSPVEEGVTYEFVAVPVRFHAPDVGFRCAKDPQR